MPGAFVFRSDGGLLYFNVDHVRDRFLDLLAAREDRVTTEVYFLGAVPLVDLAGAESVRKIFALDEATRKRIADAADFALASPLPAPETALNHVFAQEASA